VLSSFGWWSIPVTFAVSYVLLGIEEIGVEIEDPFEGDENDLPLESITAVIRRNVAAFVPHGATKGQYERLDNNLPSKS